MILIPLCKAVAPSSFFHTSYVMQFVHFYSDPSLYGIDSVLEQDQFGSMTLGVQLQIIN